MSIDFTNIIVKAMRDEYVDTFGRSTYDEFATAVLAASVRDLCPACGGSGIILESDGGYEGAGCHEIDCDHPDAPTIGQLLAKATA